MMTTAQLKARYKLGMPVTVGILGDSIGCGKLATGVGFLVDDPVTHIIDVSSQHDTRIRGWAIQVYEALQASNASSTIQNVSASGSHAENHVTWDTVGMLAARDPKPDVVLISLGVNDSISPDYNTEAEFKTAMGTLISDCISNGMQPVLVKENDVDPSRYNDRSDGITYSQFMQFVNDLATTHSLELIDFFAGFNPATQLSDTVHPNDSGHTQLAGKVVTWLEGAAHSATLALGAAGEVPLYDVGGIVGQGGPVASTSSGAYRIGTVASGGACAVDTISGRVELETV